ncbi:hypothetical protein ACV229_21200 [Burkholderia sp. MR1-5-21]
MDEQLFCVLHRETTGPNPLLRGAHALNPDGAASINIALLQKIRSFSSDYSNHRMAQMT